MAQYLCEMRLKLFSTLVLLVMVLSWTNHQVSGRKVQIPSGARPGTSIGGILGVEEQNIAVAPNRQCPPPKKMDASGRCKDPWG